MKYTEMLFEGGTEEIPLVYHIADDGTSVAEAVVDAEAAVDELEEEKAEEEIAA